MNLRVLALLVLVVLPGVAFMGISSFYLFPEWATLTASHQQYQTLAASGASERDLSIAQAAENRHRLNCFAEGVGVLLGGVIAAIGIHGICTLPHRTL
jgi:hypothetical protein